MYNFNYKFYTQDLKLNQALLNKYEKLQQDNKELFENVVRMHELLISSMESSSKMYEKYSTANKKLFDTEMLVTALTKKVDELADINISLVNESIEKTLIKQVS